MLPPAEAGAPRLLLPARLGDARPPLGQVAHALAGETMGTTWSARALGPPGLKPEVIARPVRALLDALVADLSHWEPDSALSRFNRAAPGWHRPPSSLATVVDAAVTIAAASDGAFDPTAGALVQRWGFGPPGPAEADPPPADWRALAWDGRRMFQNGRLQLDLSAIAKGYAVDRLSALLADLGLPHHLVEIGGELRGRGVKADGLPWWVDIEPPDPACSLAPLRVALHEGAIATSGDYRRFYRDETGQRVSHTLDPRAGRPVAHGLASVSVVHDSTLWADGWSTALMALGADDGMALATQHRLAARFVRRAGDGFEETLSPAFIERLA